MEAFVRDLPNVHVFYEDESSREGVRKTQQNTSDYQIELEAKMRKDQVRFADCLFTTTRKWNDKGDAPALAKAEMRSQMERYHYEIKEAKDAYGKPKYAMTGKMGGAQDDIHIALSMFNFWPPIIMQRNRHRRNGF